MKLFEAEQMTWELMKFHGLVDKGWNFDFDDAVSRAGCCKYSRKLITLSAKLTLLNDVAEVKDTALHEIAHALAPKCAHHGPEWKKICVQIGARPIRCYDNDKMVTPPAKYIATCPNGHTYNQSRKRVDQSCGKCCHTYNPKFKLKQELNPNYKKD